MKKLFILLAAAFAATANAQVDETVIVRQRDGLHQVPQRFAYDGVTTLYTNNDNLDHQRTFTIVNDDLQDVKEINLGIADPVNYTYKEVRQSRAISGIVAELYYTDVLGEYRYEDYGSHAGALDGTTWQWNDDGNGMWGNLGMSYYDDMKGDVPGSMWWAVSDLSEFANQTSHAGSDSYYTNDMSQGSYMTFDKGWVKCYDKNGNVYRSSQYSIDFDYNNGGNMLHTNEPSILWPFQINGGGTYVTRFNITNLDEDKMTLVYDNNNSWGSWSEGSFWRFKCVGTTPETTDTGWTEANVLDFIQGALDVYTENGRTIFVKEYFYSDITTNYPSRYYAIDTDGVLRLYYAYYDVQRYEYKGEWGPVVEEGGQSYYTDYAVGMEYRDMSTVFDGEQFDLSQTLFNEDEKYEWLRSRHELKTVTTEADRDEDGMIDYKSTITSAFCVGYDVVSEGTVIASIDMPEGYYGERVHSYDAHDNDAELIIINNKVYLGIDARDMMGNDYKIYYKIDATNPSNINEVKSVRTSSSVTPGVVGRGDMITIRLEGDTNAPAEVVTTDAAGRVSNKTMLPAGQKTMQMSVRNFNPGVNCVNIKREGKVIGTHKIIVK